MAILTRSPKRNRHRGWTVCLRCRRDCPNDQLVMLVKRGAKRGAWYCPTCADEMTGGLLS